MAQKIFKVVKKIGRKRKVVFETNPFDETDNFADFEAYHAARKAEEKYRMDQYRESGAFVKTDVYRCLYRNRK